MTVDDLPNLPGFSALKEIDVIKLIMWWAHRFEGREWVDSKFIRARYGQLHRAVPAGGFTAFFRALEGRKPPHIIKSRQGYKLEHRVLQGLSDKYGRREATVRVEKLLLDLPAALPALQERAYLEEALACFKHGAFRATVVMAWNLAFDHVCYWILNDPKRLSDFNARAPIRFAGMKYPPITKREDFFEMKESHVVEIAASAGVISTNTARILREKLTRRNMAAHPSDVSTPQPTAEEVVRDLVENVVLKLQ